MGENKTQINLETFADGALAERLNQELQRVLDNVADPNTDPKKARKVTISLTVKPNANRQLASVLIDAKSSLQPSMPIETQMLIGYTAEGVVGAELKSGVPGQTYFDVESEEVRADTGEIVPKDDKVIQFK